MWRSALSKKCVKSLNENPAFSGLGSTGIFQKPCDRDTTSHAGVPLRTRTRTYAQFARGNYYDVLNITPKASQSQVKAAYYRLSKEYHPDINKDAGAKQNFSLLSEAYEILGNKKKRRLYDQGLLNPLDPRSGHQAAGADDAQYKEFIKRHGTFGKRGKPPTGRTNVYNFDEFYKQHYGESMDAQKRYKSEKETVKEQESHIMKKKRIEWASFLGMVAVIGAIIIRMGKFK